MVLASLFSTFAENKNPFLIFILSVLGGYPIAAKCLENDDLSKNNASYLIYACVNPGISFMTVIVSKTLIKNEILGLLVILSVYISSFLLFLFTYLIFKPKVNINTNAKNDFVDCVSSSIKSIINMSAFVILFSSFEFLLFSYAAGDLCYQFFEHLSLSKESIFSILSGILEISSGITSAVTSGCSLWIICALLSFGGICVSFQIFSILKGKSFSKRKFYLFRILHAGLSCIILNILKLFIKPDLTVMYSPDALMESSVSQIMPATIALVLLSIVFLLTVKNDMEIKMKV